QVGHDLEDLLVGLAESDHQARLGGHAGHAPPELLQQPERMRVVGAGPGLPIEPRHRLEVVVHDVRRRRLEDLERALEPAPEVGHEDLDAGGRRELADPPDAFDEMPGAAVAQVVAVDAGDHDVAQSQGGDGAREVEWLVRIERIGTAMADVAERTAAGALVTHDHERRRALAEALADVRAGRLLADRVQPVLPQDPLDLVEAAVGPGRLHANPFGLAQHLGRRHHLDGNARRLGGRLLLDARVRRLAARFGRMVHGSVRSDRGKGRGPGDPIIADAAGGSAPRTGTRRPASSSPAAATLRITPWLRMSVTASPGMPQGSMRPKGPRSIATLRASP